MNERERRVWARWAFGLGIILPVMIHESNASNWWYFLVGLLVMLGAQHGWED